MSFITTLDQLFDEKNLLDLLYGYYLQYIGIKDQYWNAETLEVLDVIPKEPIEKSHGGSIEGKTFTVIDIQTKEVVFSVELENFNGFESGEKIFYVNGKYLLRGYNKVLIYDEIFDRIEFIPNYRNNFRHSWHNEDNIFIDAMGGIDIYNWKGSKIASIICNTYCYNDTKLIVSTINKLDVYDIKDFQLLKSFDVDCRQLNCTGKYVFGWVKTDYLILNLELLNINLLPRDDIRLNLAGDGRVYECYSSPYIQNDILYAITNNDTLVLYSLTQNTIIKAIDITINKFTSPPRLKYATSNYLFCTYWNTTVGVSVLNLHTSKVTLLASLYVNNSKYTTNGVLLT